MATRLMVLLARATDGLRYTVVQSDADGVVGRLQQGTHPVAFDAIEAEIATVRRAIRRAVARPADARRQTAVTHSGRLLFDLLLPPVIKARLRALQGGELLIAAHDLPLLPWPALHDGQQALGLSWSVGELSWGDPPTRPKTRADGDRLLLVADPAGDLPAARYEGEALMQALAEEAGLACDLRMGRLGRADLLRIFKSFRMIHFAGHADPAGDGSAGGWRLADGHVDATAIRALAGDGAPDLVFINACRSHQTDGMVAALLDAGVRHVIGTGVDLPDLPGADFATQLYRSLREGAPIGQAMRAARQRMASANNPVWLAYRLYGDPATVYVRGRRGQQIMGGVRRGIALAIRLEPLTASPQAIAEASQRARDAVRRIVGARGGRLLPGRGLVARAVFGVPFSHENDLERAVDAALALVDQAASVAIDAGPLVATGLDVVGAPMAWTEAECWRTGQGVWPSPAVRQQLGDRAEWGPADQLVALRRARPQPVHALIGRQAELARLAHAAEAITQGTAVTVLGPAGIGKSHLASAALARLGDRFVVVRSAAPRYLQGGPFEAIGAVLRQLIEVPDDAPPAVVYAALQASIDRLDTAPQADFLSIDALLSAPGDRLADRIGALAAALDLPEHAAGVDPRAVAPAVCAFIAAWARTQPLALCFDDVHALSDAGLAVVEELVAEPIDATVFLLCVARPTLLDRAPRWGQFGAHTQIELGPLPARAAEAVVRQIMPKAAPETVAALIRRAEGNPLFLRELGLAALDGDDALPSTIEAVMQARIDRLAPAAQTVLRAAAVFGRTFWVEGVARLLDADARLMGQLEALSAARFIQPDARSELTGAELTGAAQWRFAHPLLQEVVTGGTPARARRVWHARAALWLSDEIPGRDGRLSQIAWHLESAADHARAASTWWAAAARATAAPAPVEAADALRAALRCATQAPDALTPLQHAQAEAQLAEHAIAGGAVDEAAARYDRALALPVPPIWQARWLRARANVDESRGDLNAAREGIAAARAVLTRLTDAEAAEVRWWLARDAAWLALRDGAYEQAEALLRAAITTVDALPLAQAHLYNLLGITAAGQGRADDAQAAYRMALAAARRVDAPERIAAISLNLGNLAVDQNDYDAGIEWYGRAIRERARQGNRSGLARAYANLGTLHGTRGEYAEAARYLEEAIRIRARTGHVESAVYEANLGEVHLKQGRLDAAGPYLERAIAQCRAGIAPGYLLPNALRGLAELRLAQGDPAAAITAAREALALAEEAGNQPHAGIARRVLGEAMARQADPAAAAMLDAAIASLERLELPLELGHAYAARAQVTADPADAERLRADARALFEALGARDALARLDDT